MIGQKRNISASVLRDKTGDTLHDVAVGGNIVVITTHGRPLAALVPLRMVEDLLPDVIAAQQGEPESPHRGAREQEVVQETAAAAG